MDNMNQPDINNQAGFDPNQNQPAAADPNAAQPAAEAPSSYQEAITNDASQQQPPAVTPALDPASAPANDPNQPQYQYPEGQVGDMAVMPTPGGGKGKIIGVIVIVLLLVLGGGGYYLYSKKANKPTENTTPTPTTSVTTTVTATGTSTESSGNVEAYYTSVTGMKPTATKAVTIDKDFYPTLNQVFDNEVKLTTETPTMIYVVNRQITTEDVASVKAELTKLGYQDNNSTDTQLIMSKGSTNLTITFAVDKTDQATIEVAY